MRNLLIIPVLVTVALLGALLALAWQQYSVSLVAWWQAEEILYQAVGKGEGNDQPAERIGWSVMLPKSDAVVLDKFQSPRSLSFSDQVVRSIEAGSSQQYRASLYSTEVVDTVLEKRVTLPGFIVPLALEEERRVASFFVVPYFGACIHYPSPPPNQMVYVSLPEAIALPDINEPYLFTGVLKEGLFEDLLGTSAYIMAVERIGRYFGNPDDVRDHGG